jgi:hypothetical protein
MSNALAVNDTVASVGRLRALSRPHTHVTTLEVGTLMLIGALAGWMSVFIKLRLMIPGNAIILAVFPMVFGLALVPRRMAGTLMGASGLAAALIFRAGAIGATGAGALTSLCATGVLLDVALTRARSGWFLYAAIVLAGLGANLAAFGARAGTKLIGIDPGIRLFATWWPQAVVTYAACGAIAGLISAIALFHLSAKNRAQAASEA